MSTSKGLLGSFYTRPQAQCPYPPTTSARRRQSHKSRGSSSLPQGQASHLSTRPCSKLQITQRTRLKLFCSYAIVPSKTSSYASKSKPCSQGSRLFICSTHHQQDGKDLQEGSTHKFVIESSLSKTKILTTFLAGHLPSQLK